MKNLYKLIYTINDFEKTDENLFDVEDFLDEEFKEFKDVFDILDKVKLEPRTELIEKILIFSK